MWSLYISIIGVFSMLFLLSAVYALHWASKNGQLSEFQKGASVIFDEEEPEGVPTDYFPGQIPGSKK